MGRKALPIGMDGFEKLRKNDFYYVDKTGFIAELLKKRGEVNLFTRPRRFGKSLNMSMLKAFFEINTDPGLFEGLKISEEQALCDEYMGKFPVISISLKSVDGLTFDAAKESLRFLIGMEVEQFYFLSESRALTEGQRQTYRSLIEKKGDGSYTMSDVTLAYSIQTLSALLSKHYGKKTIILIDEYDVPLDKAFQSGYYNEMVLLLRGLLGNALKSNDSLYFAVLTGCLRISKESIFTGLNNLKVHGITDVRYDTCFGFTDGEVRELLAYYGQSEHAEEMKSWYDGYRFGEAQVYCPWDVLNYCDLLLAKPTARPQNYWANTSGNAMVRRFIDKAQKETRDEIEKLVAGEAITKAINQELTYGELDKSVENLWSVLFATGYLTAERELEDGRYELTIPNREIESLFVSQIQEWFQETTREDHNRLETFCKAFSAGDAGRIEELLEGYLWDSISIRDTFVRIDRKENFYHGLLLGLLRYRGNWLIRSNAESGEGYCDILIETPERIGMVIEIKYAQNGDLTAACKEALSQIRNRHYEARLADDGMKTVLRYGIAFYKKQCRVLADR